MNGKQNKTKIQKHLIHLSDTECVHRMFNNFVDWMHDKSVKNSLEMEVQYVVFGDESIIYSNASICIDELLLICS